MSPDIVGLSDIEDRLGLASHTVSVWRRRYDSFPEPGGNTSGRPWWYWEQIEEWLRETGREGLLVGQRRERTKWMTL